MTACVELPELRDDESTLELAISRIVSAERELEHLTGTFGQVGNAVTADWVGPAANVFVGAHGQGAHAMDLLRGSYARVAGEALKEYHDEVVTARSVVNRAHGHIEEALSNYQREAANAAQSAAGHVTDFLSGLVQEVEKVVNEAGEEVEQAVSGVWHHFFGGGSSEVNSDDKAKAQRLHDSLNGWRPGLPTARLTPLAGPIIVPVMPALSTIDQQIRSVGGFIEEHVQSGISWLVGKGVHLLQDALNWLHELWDDLKSAIHTAWTWVCDAFKRLYDLGRTVAQAIVSGVEAALKFVWTVDTVVARGVRAVAEISYIAVRDYFEYEFLGRVQERRWGSFVTDRAAQQRFLNDPSVRRRDDALRGLALDGHKDVDGLHMLPQGYQVFGGPFPLAHDGSYTVYVTYEPDRKPHYVVAFAGTRPSDSATIEEDIEDAAGETTQESKQVIAIAQQVQHLAQQHGGSVEFTGWSLGGRLAAMASVATGAPAVTFNAAGIGSGDYAAATSAYHRHHPGKPASEAQITNIHETNEPLSIGESTHLIDQPAGNQVRIGGTGDGPVASHDPANMSWDPGSRDPRDPSGNWSRR